MPPARGRPPLPLLRLIYTRTDNLGAFIASLVDERDRALFVTEADPPAYKELLRRTAVALDDDYKAPSQLWRLPNAVEATGMKEVRTFKRFTCLASAELTGFHRSGAGGRLRDARHLRASRTGPTFEPADDGLHVVRVELPGARGSSSRSTHTKPC
jgi:hypothetical protein